MSGQSNQRPLTWVEMVKLCPELEELRNAFHSWSKKNQDPDEDSRKWTEWVKPQMRPLVGWYARRWPRDHPMASHDAWDTAFRMIYHLAPMGWRKNG